jgi:hypothetical protein
MARRTSGVIDICENFVHWHAGRSKSEVAGSLGLSRNTVRKYVAAAEAAGMRPGGALVSGEEWARLAREWFPQLAAGVTVATIHQRLAGERGLAVTGGVAAPVCGGEPARRGPPVAGAGAAPRAG